MDAGHAVQPGLAELGRGGVGLGQAVLQVHQHLGVPLVLLHLRRGHQHRADPLGQVLDVRRERRVLQTTQGGARRLMRIQAHTSSGNLRIPIFQFWDFFYNYFSLELNWIYFS